MKNGGRGVYDHGEVWIETLGPQAQASNNQNESTHSGQQIQARTRKNSATAQELPSSSYAFSHSRRSFKRKPKNKLRILCSNTKTKIIIHLSTSIPFCVRRIEEDGIDN